MINVLVFICCNKQLHPKWERTCYTVVFTSIAASKVVAETLHKIEMHCKWKKLKFFCFSYLNCTFETRLICSSISNIVSFFFFFSLLQFLMSYDYISFLVSIIRKTWTCHNSGTVFSANHPLKQSSQPDLENKQKTLQKPLLPPSSKQTPKTQKPTHWGWNFMILPTKDCILIYWEGTKVSSFTWCWHFY